MYLVASSTLGILHLREQQESVCYCYSNKTFSMKIKLYKNKTIKCKITHFSQLFPQKVKMMFQVFFIRLNYCSAMIKKYLIHQTHKSLFKKIVTCFGNIADLDLTKRKHFKEFIFSILLTNTNIFKNIFEFEPFHTNAKI